ncbi:MAG: hypothetical protein ACRDGV_06895 [Candidatus Limnocylindria bacterium]
MPHSEKKEKKQIATRLATSVPAGIGAMLLVGAVAFGANAVRPDAEEAAAKPAAPTLAGAKAEAFGFAGSIHETAMFVAHEGPELDATIRPEKPEAKPSDEPKPEPTPEQEKAQPAPAEQPKPQPEEKPKPKETEPAKPKPATTALELFVKIKEGKVKLHWNAFIGPEFGYFKVVRSFDGTVTWPASGDDQVVGVIGDPNAPWFFEHAPCGKQLHYRVFAVRAADGGGYVTLAASNVATTFIECAPKPEPIEGHAIGLEVAATGDGIKLQWEKCRADGFVAYKIVRSQAHGDPRFPLNAGTELVGVISDRFTTGFVDAAVAAGETWTYRVVAVANDGHGGYAALCESPARAATAAAE